MPIKDSAKKALRQNVKRRTANAKTKRIIHDLDREIRSLVAQNQKDKASALLSKYFKLVDKATKTGIFKKNSTARKKSLMSKLVK